MKRSEVFKNLIVDFIISSLVLKIKFSNPYTTIFESFPWDRFFKVEFKTQTSLKNRGQGQSKDHNARGNWVLFLVQDHSWTEVYGSSKVVQKFMFINMTKIESETVQLDTVCLMNLKNRVLFGSDNSENFCFIQFCQAPH